MLKIRIKPGWRKLKGLHGYHRIAKRKPAPKRMTQRALTKALAGAIAHGLDFSEGGRS